MSIYFFAITIAAFLQIGTIYLLRDNILKSLLLASPLILIFQFLFLWSYAHAPNFLVIWFITTAVTNSLAFLAGYLIWKEHLSPWNLVGLVLIMVGVVLLRLK